MLRDEIIAEMRRYMAAQDETFPEWATPYKYEYCTWWFKFHIPHTNKEVRRELERMEREGIVTSNRREKNNTRWNLVEFKGEHKC